MRYGCARPLVLAAIAAAALGFQACGPSIQDSVAKMGSQSTASGNVQIAFTIEDAEGRPEAGVLVTVEIGQYFYESSTNADGFFKVPVYYNPQWGLSPDLTLTFPAGLALEEVRARLRVLDYAGSPLSGWDFQSNLGPLSCDDDGFLYPSDELPPPLFF